MSDMEKLRNRAETAEKKIAELQAQFDELQSQLNKQQPKGKSKKQEKNEKSEKKSSKDDEKVTELPFKFINDEKYVISEKGKDCTMTVTICNGESNPPFISSKGINYLKNNFDSTSKDVFVDTYAKCGTTLCINLVYQIYTVSKIKCSGANQEKMGNPWEATPWIEVDVSQQLINNDKPTEFWDFIDKTNKESNNVRIWKSHAHWVNFPVRKMNENTRIIHCTRNPKDVICSYFDFFQKEPFVQYKGDFNTLFDWFCDGSVVHSNFWDFELQWWRAAQEYKNQILWITFEELVRIPYDSIKKVANFLNIKLTQEQIEFIGEEISFDKVKMRMEKQKGTIGAALMNKGQIGRWQKKLTKEQSARMDRISGARFANTGIDFDYGDDEAASERFYQKQRN